MVIFLGVAFRKTRSCLAQTDSLGKRLSGDGPAKAFRRIQLQPRDVARGFDETFCQSRLFQQSVLHQEARRGAQEAQEVRSEDQSLTRRPRTSDHLQSVAQLSSAIAREASLVSAKFDRMTLRCFASRRTCNRCEQTWRTNEVHGDVRHDGDNNVVSM